jgi:uncharacterized protein YceK
MAEDAHPANNAAATIAITTRMTLPRQKKDVTVALPGHQRDNPEADFIVSLPMDLTQDVVLLPYDIARR